MTVYTCLPKFPKSHAQKLEYEHETAKELSCKMDREDMQSFLALSSEDRLLLTWNKIANFVSENWVHAFADKPSITRTANHIAKRCRDALKDPNYIFA